MTNERIKISITESINCNTEKIAALQEDLSKANAEISVRGEQIVSQQNEINAQQSELDAKQAEIEAQQREIEAKQSEINELEKDVKQMDDLVTKSTIDFKNDRVTSIANNVFAYNHRLVSVDAPNVETVKTQAFRGCDSLTDVNIPKCNAILDEGFIGATALTELDLPTENVEVGNSCFEGCTSLEEVVAPNMVSVGLNAFKDCSSLKTVNYPKARVGSSAFSNCNLDTVVLSGNFGGVNSLTTGTGADTDTGANVFFNSTVKNLKLTEARELNINSFNGFNGSELVKIQAPYLKDLKGTLLRDWLGNGSTLTAKAPKLEIIDLSELNNSNTSGGQCFKGYQHLKRVFLGFCNLSWESFQFCTNLEMIRTYAAKIPASCFASCENLRSVNTSVDGTFYFVANGALSGGGIGGSAFLNCKGMQRILLPSYGLTNIDGDAFKGCDNLTTVYYAGTEEQWNNITIGSGNECLLNANFVYNARPKDYGDFI